MSQKNKSDLKKMFVSQAIPTESNFSDLIDSVQATLVANGNIKLRNRSNGSVEISAEIPEPEPVIPKFINQFPTNGPTPIYDGDGVPFFIQSTIDYSITLQSGIHYQNLPDGSIVLLVNSGKNNSQCAIAIDGTIYQSSGDGFLCVVLLVVHRNSSGTPYFVHQVIIGEKLK